MDTKLILRLLAELIAENERLQELVEVKSCESKEFYNMYIDAITSEVGEMQGDGENNEQAT